MKTLAIVLHCCVAAILPSSAGEKDALITVMDLKSLAFELPTAIRLRADLAALKRPEYVKSMKELRIGFDIESLDTPSSSVTVYRAWDGVVFLLDDCQMGLWVRHNNEWQCLVSGLRVEKTLGGAPPGLPARYLGEGFFAITETVPGDVAERTEKGYPQALAVTFLIDSKEGKVKERSEAFVYDHNPPVKVPESWVTRYKLKSELAAPSDGDKPPK